MALARHNDQLAINSFNINEPIKYVANIADMD